MQAVTISIANSHSVKLIYRFNFPFKVIQILTIVAIDTIDCLIDFECKKNMLGTIVSISTYF